MEHVVAASQPGRFLGWPANNGLWSWDGGREILVGFSSGQFIEQRGHNIGPKVDTYLTRSRDGGRTWAIERPDNFVGRHGPFAESPGGLAFDGPDFALRVVGIGYHGTDDPEGGFFWSVDRGRSWRGPDRFGALTRDPRLAGMEITARTGYLPTGAGGCLVFMSAKPPAGGSDKAFVARTADGSRSFDFVTWIVPLDDPHRAVMPAVVRRPDGRLVAALRRRHLGDKTVPCWVDAYGSQDGGQSWTFLSRVAETGTRNGNPTALAALADGRLCCAYGDRTRGLMLARLSADGGGSWGPEVVLRDDYQADAHGDMDFGYPRLVQADDGRLVATYYWATRERFEQHIAATLWRP